MAENGKNPKAQAGKPAEAAPTEQDLERAVADANANLASFRSRAKFLDEIAKARESYEAEQVSLQASEEALRDNQTEVQDRLEKLLGPKAVKVDEAVEACNDEIVQQEKTVTEQKAAVTAQQATVEGAKAATKQAQEAYTAQKDAAKRIQARLKSADAFRLEAMKQRKDNPALAYYLVKAKFKAELDGEPKVVDADTFQQDLLAKAEVQVAQARKQAEEEALLASKANGLAESEKALTELKKGLEPKIREKVSAIRPDGPAAVPDYAPAKPGQAWQEAPTPDQEAADNDASAEGDAVS